MLFHPGVLAGTGGFNGGKSQVNFNFLHGGGDYAFINLLKLGQGWSFINNANAPVTPDLLDSNGYPTSIVNSGVFTVFDIPPQSERPGNYVITWDGNGTISLGMQHTLVSGSLTSSGGSGRYVFSTTAGGNSGGNVGISAIGSPRITNLQVFHADDEAALLAGEIFGTKFLQRLKEANFGVIRFMDWQVNVTSNVTTWSTRTPILYSMYGGYQLDSNLYGGITTNTGAAYAVSAPTAWTGLVDKATVQVLFSRSAFTAITGAASSGVQTILTVNTGANDTESFTVGESVLVSGMIGGTWTGLNGTWTVASASSGSVTINKDSSGFTGSPSGGTLYHSVISLNVGGTGDITVLNQYAEAFFTSSYPIAGTYQSFSTLVYDATLNAWIKQGGDANGSAGLQNGVPPELMLRLCTEVGAHPYFVAPAFAVDPVTDFMPSLATYVRDNSPSWMIPRFEGPNETWNNAGGFYTTQYAKAKATAYGWGADPHNWYGKVMSVMGQAISAVYSDDRTRYHVLCGVQTGTGNTTGGTHGSDARLSSAQYVAQAAPAQSGYTKSAASNWVTHVCNTQYFDPSEYHTNQELVDAYNYSVTYASDPTSQASIAASYMATNMTGSGAFTMPNLAIIYANWKTWAQGFGVNAMCGYEGGYSPDYSSTNVTSVISGATSANPCVLTLASTSLQGTATTGNPAVVGMTLTISGLGDAMGTALNGNTYTVTAVSGNSVTINADTSTVGAFTTNGTTTYVNSATWLNALRLAGKSAPLLQNYTITNYNNFVGLTDSTFTAEFPSCFQLAGRYPSSNAWSVLEDIYQTPNPPQWLAFIQFNH